MREYVVKIKLKDSFIKESRVLIPKKIKNITDVVIEINSHCISWSYNANCIGINPGSYFSGEPFSSDLPGYKNTGAYLINPTEVATKMAEQFGLSKNNKKLHKSLCSFIQRGFGITSKKVNFLMVGANFCERIQ